MTDDRGGYLIPAELLDAFVKEQRRQAASPYLSRRARLGPADLPEMLKPHVRGASCWCGTGADPEHDADLFDRTR